MTFKVYIIAGDALHEYDMGFFFLDCVCDSIWWNPSYKFDQPLKNSREIQPIQI